MTVRYVVAVSQPKESKCIIQAGNRGRLEDKEDEANVFAKKQDATTWPKINPCAVMLKRVRASPKTLVR